MTAGNVKSFSQRKYIIHKKKSPGEKHLWCKNVVNPLSKVELTGTPEDFTLEKSLISATNVENFCANLNFALHMKDFTLENLIECSKCGKLSASSGLYYNHQSSHWKDLFQIAVLWEIL